MPKLWWGRGSPRLVLRRCSQTPSPYIGVPAPSTDLRGVNAQARITVASTDSFSTPSINNLNLDGCFVFLPPLRAICLPKFGMHTVFSSPSRSLILRDATVAGSLAVGQDPGRSILAFHGRNFLSCRFVTFKLVNIAVRGYERVEIISVAAHCSSVETLG